MKELENLITSLPALLRSTRSRYVFPAITEGSGNMSLELIPKSKSSNRVTKPDIRKEAQGKGENSRSRDLKACRKRQRFLEPDGFRSRSSDTDQDQIDLPIGAALILSSRNGRLGRAVRV